MFYIIHSSSLFIGIELAVQCNWKYNMFLQLVCTVLYLTMNLIIFTQLQYSFKNAVEVKIYYMYLHMRHLLVYLIFLNGITSISSSSDS